MNELDSNTNTGTFGELLVQLRLFQHGVQAAPPLKDSGNDLIAVKGPVFRAIQVKTTTQDRFDLRELPDRYHLLALVALHGKIRDASLDETQVFLLSRQDLLSFGANSLPVAQLAPYGLSADRVDHLFQSGTRRRP